MSRIAQELVKLARRLVADDEFTVVKPLRLKKEGGTRVSLENAKAILDAGYGIKEAIFTFDRKRGDYRLDVGFFRGEEEAWHSFTGFSAGYGGEGPRGMIEFFKMFGKWVDPDKVMSPDLRERGALAPMEEFQ